MDHEYPPSEFDRTSSPANVGGGISRDAKNLHDDRYSDRWIDVTDRDERSRISRKLDRRPQYNPRSLGPAKPRTVDEQRSDVAREQRSDVARKLAIIPTFDDEAPKLAKNTIDAPPIFATIQELLTSVSKQEPIRSVVFEVHWDVGGFLSAELEGQSNLAAVLTLSGTRKKAFAATCEDYIRYFWSELGLGVLEWLSLVVHDLGYAESATYSAAKLEGLFLEIASLEPHESPSSFSLIATGTTESLIKVAQILTWIAATFRRPKYGGLSYSTPTFRKRNSISYKIGISDLEPIKSELCWCPMFANGVIARYFPTPERHDEVGLEIPFDLMVILGRIWYPMEYLNGFVLKGYSTILVPTRRTQQSVQWHFIHNVNPRKKIQMGAIKLCCENVEGGIELRALQTARTFVGWTRDADIHVATKTSGYDSIRDSKVPFAPRRPRLAREMTSGIGTSGLGFFGVQLGAKVVIPKGLFGPVKREHILLEDMMLNSRDNPLLLWDAGTSRGWMVSEIAVLLMILHVWAARQTDRETLLKIIPFAERSSDDAKASYDVIRTNRNLQLRSQANGDGEDLKFMTQIENIFAAIESRKEEIITRNNESARFSTPMYLKGWELTDIAHSKPWFKEKRILLDKTCGPWSNAFEKQREVLVLFCQGVGDLIQPSTDESFCQTWRSVPKGHSYVAATVACIENLGLHCQLANRFEACNFNHKNCPSRLQELNHKPSSRSIPVPSTGAIILGKLHHSLYKACSPDSGQLQDMARKRCIEKGSAQETHELAAVGNGVPSSSLPEFKATSKDVCSTPNGDNNDRIEGRTMMGEGQVNAC